MAYTEPDTLLLGGIPAHSEDELAQFVNDASDEIDSILGTVFDTPITMRPDGQPLDRPALLTLTRINRYLASGRYIMARAASGEEDNLHTYGARLVREALDALRDINSGKVVFAAKKLPDPTAEGKGPRISNAEEQSNVDAFYNAQTGPGNMMYGSPYPFRIGRLESE